MEEMIAHYENTESNTFFSQLINLKQKGLMGEHIEYFQKLNISVTDILEEHKINLFIGTLKDNIQHEVHILEPDSLEKEFRLERKIECKIMATRKPKTHFYKEGSVALLDFHNLHGWHHNNWKKKEQKDFATIVIENTLKFISVLRINYFT